MNKTRTKNHRIFYKNYSDDWKKIKEEILERDNYECVKCQRKDKLAVAHLDQITENNDPENLLTLCPKCHIQHDQPYHVFSMQASRSRKTDNSFFEDKVDLRLESLKSIKNESINVLEAYAGDGLIWRNVQKHTKKELKILKIEKKDEKTGVYLKGDNLKFIGLFDMSHYDIIDLDAYGSPYNQLKVIFLKKFKGIVHCTFIQAVLGRINNKMLEDIGYSRTQIKKCPSLFSKNGMEKMKQYLAINGVKKIHIKRPAERKNYFWFSL
jgi:superoxide dismutase